MKAFRLFSILIILFWLADLAVPAAAAYAPRRSPLATSAGRQVVPATAPGAFSKLNPPNGSIQPTNPILRWATSIGATGYQYCVSLVDNDATCSWVNIGNQSSWMVSGLNAHTVYYWQVTALKVLNPSTNANAGTWWSFTTGDVPGSFSKWLPGNNSNAEPVILNLSWNSNGSSTDTYQYCLDTTNNNTCDTNWISTGTSTGLTIGSLSPSTPYYWQVRAVNSNGSTEADGGAWWAFTTGTPATHTVTTENDSGPGSLRQAITDASPGDIINFASGYEIFLASTLTIDTQVTIDGSGRIINISGDTNGDGSAYVQVFSIGVDGMVALNNLVVIDGRSSGHGGGIDNFGHLTLTNCNISANSSPMVGGIYNESGASLTIANSKISSNSAYTDAGGIKNAGSLVLTDSNIYGNSTTVNGAVAGGINNVENATAAISRTIISHNSTVQYGGGIYNSGTLTVMDSNFITNNTDPTNAYGGAIANSSSGSLTVQGSLFENNSSSNGGAIFNENGGSLAVINSTFSGNSAVIGGAFFVRSTNPQTITNSTISGNTATTFTGGIDSLATITLRNTIVANNTDPSSTSKNCSGIFFDGGNNLFWPADTTCPGILDDPLLVPLADNGGPTQTMALTLGSPAIDAYTANCPATDQRGVSRPQGFRCDIGAFELVYYPVFLPLVLR